MDTDRDSRQANRTRRLGAPQRYLELPDCDYGWSPETWTCGKYRSGTCLCLLLWSNQNIRPMLTVYDKSSRDPAVRVYPKEEPFFIARD
jgi:hypothetical protein